MRKARMKPRFRCQGSYHGAGKVALEAFFSVLGQRRPGGLTILRPSNIYGPGQALRAGFGIIPTLLERARDGGKVTIWGDGSSVRDYLYIDDMVAACRLALVGPSGVYNIGAGVGTSLNELIEQVQQITGRSVAGGKATSPRIRCGAHRS